MIPIDLSSKSAIITGGTRGIGRAINLTLARAGASIGSLYRSDDAAAERTVADAFREGPHAKHFAIKADVAIEQQAVSAANDALEQLGGQIDYLILNAAAGAGGPMVEMSTEDWKRSFETNVHGSFYMVRTCAPHIRPGGSIIFISSGAGHDPLLNSSSYGASKAAFNHASAILAQELGPSGIRVNVVSPGRTYTGDDDINLTPDRWNEGQRSTVAETALRRLGTAQDVANVVLFFVSDLCGFATGQWLRVNGGRV